MQVPRLVREFEKELSIRQSHNLIENPSVSVIMPTFARAKDGSLGRALDSIIQQIYSDFELLIVDDGSVDGTADIVTRTMKNDDRVVYLRYAQNSGLPALRVNAGIRRSRANLLAYMFDDDLWYPNALESLVKGIGSSSFVYGQVRIWTRHDTQGSRSFIVGDRQCDMKSLSQKNMIANHAVLHRKELLDDVGYYDPHILMKRRCDWDLWLRTAHKYELRKIDCLEDADCCFILTAWDEFRTISSDQFIDTMNKPIVLDCNRTLEPSKLGQGITYAAIGLKKDEDARSQWW